MGDDANVARALSSIRAGAGYQDTASDLVRLSRLYKDHLPTIQADTKFYRADDAQLAQEDAGVILQTLAAGVTSQEQWSDRLTRVSSLLNLAYDEVSAALTFLLRKTPGALDLYPLLYAVSRPGLGKRRSNDESETSDESAVGDGAVSVEAGE